MSISSNSLELKDLWTLPADQLELFAGMTDKGSLSFAVQLKFMELQHVTCRHSSDQLILEGGSLG